MLANGVVLALSLSLIVYLLFFRPLRTTALTSNALTELDAIKVSSDTADMVAHAERMYVIVVQVMRDAWLLCGVIVFVLILIALLSISNLGWSGMLKRLKDANHDV